MPRQSKPAGGSNPALKLKNSALRDEPLVAEYRDILYLVSINSLRAQGPIPSREKSPDISPRTQKRQLNRLEKLRQEIFRKYRVGFHGGDPYLVKKKDWLSTVTSHAGTLIKNVETNWKTSLSPRVRFVTLPPNAKKYASRKGTVYQLPPLPSQPLDSPPMLTIHIDLSQIAGNRTAKLEEELRIVVRRSLEEVPRELRKPSGTWQQNDERDYRRFRLHQQGWNFRWIAYKEKIGELPSKPVSCAVPAESSIRESVDRVHRALFGTAYSARRHRAALQNASLKQELDAFNCPAHGRDHCPRTCRHAQAFMKKIEKYLR